MNSRNPYLYFHRGFTLLEMMIVVVILGILAAMVVPKIMSRPEQARIVKAKQDILAIQNALELYKLDNSFYPTTEQGITALVTKPTTAPIPAYWQSYLATLPKDPWGQPYQYLNPGTHSEIDIFTQRPNSNNSASAATASDDGNFIGNWNIQESAGSGDK